MPASPVSSLLQPATLHVQFQPTGPSPAPIMIVGEAPGEHEVRLGLPFVGPSGWELDRMLQEVGLERSMCFVTNVARERPPNNEIEAWLPTTKKAIDYEVHQKVLDRYVDPRIRFGRDMLLNELRAVDPAIVLAMGNVALWALTGQWGIRKWRGSVMAVAPDVPLRGKVIPTYHPAAVLREWAIRGTALHDLRRAKRELELGRELVRPTTSFTVRPTFEQAVETLNRIRALLDASKEYVRLAPDIETRAGHIACIGIAWSRQDAICIPLMCTERQEGYWSLDEEIEIWRLIRAVLQHPRASLRGQNWIYDQQYFHRWQFYLPPLGRDTMITHHAMFSHSPKGLDYLASLYNDHHLYWKDDGKNWDPAVGEDQLWTYNCQDCVNTLEVDEHESEAIAALTPDWPELPRIVEFQTKVARFATRMMLRGVRTDASVRSALHMSLQARLGELQKEVNDLVGYPININSSPQLQDLFYQQLNQTPVKKRPAKGGPWVPTTDDDALETIGAREPMLRPLCARIQAMRSLSKFDSTYVQMRLDTDGRLRCSFNVAGTVGYRFSSSESAFGSGGNLQNIPTGDESEEAAVPLPNIRRLFLFDPNRIGFDLDGDSADLRIVTGESGCRQMQAYFAAKAKPYVEIAKEYYRDPSITKAHRSYPRMKSLCHGTNYLGTSVGLSRRIGLLVHEVERIQKWYFGMCPEIKRWHEEIKKQVDGRGWVRNPFGYRFWFTDRISESTYREAVAIVPQSSVAIFINTIAVRLDEAAESGELPVEILLQVHDSLTGQWPSELGMGFADEIKSRAVVPIQCQHELVTIPVGLKTSTTTWGDCA